MNLPGSGIAPRLSSLVLLMLLLQAGAVMAAEQFRMITLQYRLARDVLPVIEPLVGPSGSVRAIDNHLLITASPEQLAQIETVIERLDVIRKNVRITVSHASDLQLQQRGAAVSGRASAGDVEVVVPPAVGDGVGLQVYDSNTRSRDTGTEFLTVLDGEQAFIRVGQIVPFTQRWILLTRRYAIVQDSVEFQDITTGFAVRPRYMGDQVELEITPRIARWNQAGFIDFEELSTVVRVEPGEWFDLGSTMQDRDEVSYAILAGEQRDERRNTTLRIKVD
jgi:type II secretory pathway component GspD/PulD (secretin)